MLKVRAYAKINLYLKINGKRSDGYHLIESELHTIGLFDTLEIEENMEFNLHCKGEIVPCGKENLLFKAYSLLKEKHSLPGVKILLDKKIPPARGLGGGSSNAAVLLLVLRKMFIPDLPIQALEETAIKVGADVPFFLRGGRARISGIGEKIEPLPPMQGYVLLVDPGIPLSTRAVYMKYDEQRESGLDFSQYKNHLLPAALELAPSLKTFADKGLELTGSGSAFFKIFPNLSEAEDFYGKIPFGRKWIIPLVPHNFIGE